MATGQLHAILRHIRRLVSGPSSEDQTDAQLLTRFVAHHEEAAFEALIQRHGPLVLGVCRRVLRHAQDAEDAFQATFLVLARKASSIRKGESLGGWLYGVAYHLALRARTATDRRRLHERQAIPMPHADQTTESAWRDLQPVLDEELNRLPEKYRLPLILCYLQGRTHERAARELGYPLGSMSWRLARGREILRQRLTRRGVALSLGTLGAVIAENAASGAVRPALVTTTVRAGLLFAAGHGAGAAGISSQSLTLAKGLLQTMLVTKWKIATVLLLAATALGAGAGVLVQQTVAARSAKEDRQGDPQAERLRVGQGQRLVESAKPGRTDSYGDPLPPGALVRIGTLRWRNTEYVTGITFSRDGKVVASSAADGTIRSWEMGTGKPRLTLEAGNGVNNTFALSPDGRRLASSGIRVDQAQRQVYGRLQVWDFTSGKQLLGVEKAGLSLWAIAWSPDGKSIACGCEDGSIRLWDAAAGDERLRITGHKRAVVWLAFAQDGRVLASASHDQSLRLWDAATGQQLRSVQKGRYIYFERPALAPDGKTLAAAAFPSGDPTRVPIVLWDVDTGKERRRLEDPRYNVGGGVAFSPDGRTLAAVGSNRAGDRAILLWDLASAKPRLRIEGISDYLHHLAFDPDGKTLAGAGGGGMVHLWDVATGRELEKPDAHQGIITALIYSADGRTLVTASDDYTIRLWDTATGGQRRKLAGHANWVRALALAPDGKTVASSSLDDTVRIWDASTAKELHRLPGHGKVGGTRRLAFWHDGKRLASWGDDQMLRAWDVGTGKELVNCRPHLTGVPDLPAGAEDRKRAIERERKAGLSEAAFTPGGERLVLLSRSSGHVVDVATARELFTFPGQPGASALAISTDGRTLFLAVYEKKGRLLELATGKELLTIDGLSTWPAVAFAPDGRTVAASAGPERGAFGVWELATGKEALRLASPGPAIRLSFSPDGKTLATGHSDSTALIWDLAPDSRTAALPGKGHGFERLWADLASQDAAKAYRAVWTLAAAPEKSVAFLKDQLISTAEVNADQLRHLIADLDSSKFSAREAATRELEQLSELAEPVLRKTLQGKPSLERRRRVEALLKKLAGPITLPKKLQTLRGIWVLERIGSPEARQVLAALAKGAPGARETQDAKAALERLESLPRATH